jgi:hypothetical protein
MRVPGNWRIQIERYRLVGATCASCGTSTFPARRLCIDCDVNAHMPTLVSGHSALFNQEVSCLLDNTREGATRATARAVVLASLVAGQ